MSIVIYDFVFVVWGLISVYHTRNLLGIIPAWIAITMSYFLGALAFMSTIHVIEQGRIDKR